MKFLRHPVRISFGIFLLMALGCALPLWLSAGWHPLSAWLLGANLAAPAVWWIDKSQATRQGLRVPELALHAIALVGAVPASWLSMSLLRHKTRKPIFRILYAFILLAQLAALAWWRGWLDQLES